MGVSNVYKQAKQTAIAAIKQNLSSQGAKKTANAKPEYMKMTGSIFDAPGTKDPKGTNLADLNTRASLNELNKKPVKATQGKGSNDKSSNGEINNASEGKAAASDMEGKSSDVKGKTQIVQNNKKQVDKFSANAEKQEKAINKDDKTFLKRIQQEQAEFKKDNKNIQKLTKEIEETQKEVDDAQNELDSLLARNSFSMGSSNGTSGSSNDQARITELQTIIGSKVGVMQANGKAVYSLQRNQSRTITRMNRNNTQYVKLQKMNQKAIQQQQTETSGVIKFANEVEKWSSIVQMGGQTMKLLGQVMVAASCTPWTAWMNPVGQVLQKVGSVAEMVGNYGACAANLTKTAAYAAEGNLMGAMQSAAMAMQSGAAAVNSTKGLKAEFQSIDDQANNVLNKNAANKAAKQQVEGMTDEQLNGMSRKDMRKAISNDLQAQMNGEDPTLNRANLFKDGQLSDKGKTATGNSASRAGNEFKTQMGKQGATAKSAGKATVNSFKNTASKTAKKSSTNWADNFNKFSQTMGSFAQMYMMFNGGGSMMGGNMMGMGYSNGMGYMNNGMGYNNGMNMTDAQRKAAWRQRNPEAYSRAHRTSQKNKTAKS